MRQNYQYSLWFQYEQNHKPVSLVPIPDKPDDALEVSEIIFQFEDDLHAFFSSVSEKGFLPSQIKKFLYDKELNSRLIFVQVTKQFPFIINENTPKIEYERFKVIRKIYGQYYQELSIKDDQEYTFKLIYTVLVKQRNLWKQYFSYNYKQWFVQQITILMLLQNQRPTDRHLNEIIQSAYEIKSYLIKALHLDREIRNHLIEASIKQIDLIEAQNLPKPLDDEYTKLKLMGSINHVSEIWENMQTDYNQNPIVINIKIKSQQDLEDQ